MGRLPQWSMGRRSKSWYVKYTSLLDPDCGSQSPLTQLRLAAYDSINIYSLHPQLAPSSALPLWRYPTSSSDISSIFRKYLTGELPANPWSEEALSPETDVIKAQLLALNEKGWWTVASQPLLTRARVAMRYLGGDHVPEDGFGRR